MNKFSFGSRLISVLVIAGFGLLSNPDLEALAAIKTTDDRIFQPESQSSETGDPVSTADEIYAQAMWEYINTHN